MLYHLFRWTLLKGEVADARSDWLPREDMPHPDAVAEVFGSWQKFLDHARRRRQPAARAAARGRGARARARRRASSRSSASSSAPTTCAASSRSRAAGARRPSAERDEEARRADARRARARRRRGARRRAPRRGWPSAAPAAETAAAAAPRATSRGLARRARGRARPSSRPSARTARSCCAASRSCEEAAERDRQAIAELSAALGERARPPRTRPPAERGAAEVGRSRRSRVAAGAAPSTSSSPSPRSSPPPTARTAGRRRSSTRCASSTRSPSATPPARWASSLGQAAQEAGLTWRAGVSELARTRWAKHYVVTHDGAPASTSARTSRSAPARAPGFIARIYLHVADGNGDVPRGIYVGHVGRHLPDTTT